MNFTKFPLFSSPAFCASKIKSLQKLLFKPKETQIEASLPKIETASEPVPDIPALPLTTVLLPPAIDTPVKLNTPVSYDLFNEEFSQATSLNIHDGLRLDIVKNVVPCMQANYSYLLGSSQAFQFGPTYASPDGNTLLTARYGNDLTMSVSGFKKLGNKEVQALATSNLYDPQRTTLNLGFNQAFKRACYGFRATYQGGWTTTLRYSYLIKPNFFLGADVVFIGTTGGKTNSVGFRYVKNSHILTGILERQPSFSTIHGLDQFEHILRLQYLRKVSPRLNLATELQLNPKPSNVESSLKVGYEYSFRHARVQALADFYGKLAMMLQTTSGFGLCGTIDYKRNDYRIGFTMQSVPQQVESAPSPNS